ncbi:MAG: hypothetical protein IT193_04370, partial [Propionibacteriaceae bacterium]|nr:hypothetical protein [Propionibacteriaceae bacterium]
SMGPAGTGLGRVGTGDGDAADGDGWGVVVAGVAMAGDGAALGAVAALVAVGGRLVEGVGSAGWPGAHATSTSASASPRRRPGRRGA